MYSKFAVTKC